MAGLQHGALLMHFLWRQGKLRCQKLRISQLKVCSIGLGDVDLQSP